MAAMIKCYGLGVPDEWLFEHMNNDTANALKGCIGYQPNLQNMCQVVLYKTKDESFEAYKRLNKLGCPCFIINTPAYVPKRYVK